MNIPEFPFPQKPQTTTMKHDKISIGKMIMKPSRLNQERLYGSHWLCQPSATRVGANGKPGKSPLKGAKIGTIKPPRKPG